MKKILSFFLLTTALCMGQITIVKAPFGPSNTTASITTGSTVLNHTHNLNTTTIIPFCENASTGAPITAFTVTGRTSNTIQLTFSPAVNANCYFNGTGGIGPAGLTGPAGGNGSNGANGTGFTWRGAYAGATAYVTNDVVSNAGSVYLAVASSTGVTPGTDITKWVLWASKGTDGTNGLNGSGTLSGTSSPIGTQNCTTAGTIYTNTTDASIYTCTAAGTPGTWVLGSTSGGSGGGGSSLPAVTGTVPGSTVTVGASCPTGACSFTFGGVTYPITTSANIQIITYTGSTTGRVWANSSGQLIFAHDAALTATVGTGITEDTVNTSAFPSDVFPIATLAITNTNVTLISDLRGAKTITLTAGSGPWTATKTATGYQGACPTCGDTSVGQTWSGKQVMTPTSGSAGLNLGTLSGDPSPCSNGDVWYNTSTSKYRGCVSSAAVDLGGGSATQTSYLNDMFVACITNTTAVLTNIRTNSSVAPLCTTSNDVNVGLLPFASSVNYYLSKELPPNWTGSVTFKLYWASWTAGSSEQVRFTTSTTCISPNETFDAPTFNTAVNTDRNVPAAVRTKDAFTLTLDVTGCSAGDTLLVKVIRGTPPGTNYGNVPYLLGSEWGIAHN
jgi:hypothetical protein